MAVQHPGRKSLGMAAAEFLVVAIPVLLTGLGALEAARWYLVRLTVAQALLEAARAGATQHADPHAMEEHLRLGLLPLYAGAATAAGLDLSQQRQAQQARRLRERYGLAPWHLEVLSPQPAHFQDFSRSEGPGEPPRIPNSYQAERHRDSLAQGWPEGRGAASGATIFEANTLTLRLTYPHTPLVPGLGSLLRALGRTTAWKGYAGQVLRQAGMLPIRREVSVAMHSDAHWWSEAGAATPVPAPPTADAATCTGIWCGERHGSAAIATPPPAMPLPFSQTDAAATLPTVSPAPGPEDGCGIVLCCA